MFIGGSVLEVSVGLCLSGIYGGNKEIHVVP